MKEQRGISILTQFTRAIAVLRLRPFDTSTEAGRGKERFRRAAMTTLSSGAVKAVSTLASLITVPLTFRYLGPERYGLWMVMISMISAMGFADLGIGNGLVNSISEAHGKNDRVLAREYISSAFVMLSVIAAVLAIAAIVAYPFLPWMRLFNVKSATVAAEGSRAIVALYAWFVVSIPIGVVGSAQSGFQRGYVSQSVSMLGSLGTLLALLTVIALHGNLVWLVFSSTVGSICSTTVNAWVLFRRDPWLFPFWHAFRLRAARKIFNLGIMFFVLQCAVVLSYTSDNLVIAQVMGVAAVVAYAVPQKLFGPVSQVFGMAVAPLWPAYGEAIARGDVSWVRKTFIGSLWMALWITVPACAILAFTGPWILRIFFGKGLHASTSLLIILGLWCVINCVSTVVGTVLNGIGILKIQLFVAPPVSLINLGLSIYFTKRFGVSGVCLGSIISQSVITLPLYWGVIRREFRRMVMVKGEDGPPRTAQIDDMVCRPECVLSQSGGE